jgi:hypothetical protein
MNAFGPLEQANDDKPSFLMRVNTHDQPTNWGWTSYEKLGWVTVDEHGDHPMYYARFTGYVPDGNIHHYWKAYVRFYARRPVLALRAIVESGKNPTDFADEVIN